MNIDESDTENIVIHQDEEGGGKPGAQPTRSGGKQSTLDSAFTPGRRIRGEEVDGDNGYTRVTRRATRSTSSPMHTRVVKKATPIKPIIRVMEDEVRGAAQAAHADQLSFLHRLVESVLRQLQEQQEAQAKAQKESAAEAAEVRKIVEKQGRIIDALHALSKERVRKSPTYSQVAQTGITQPNEAQKITLSSSSKESSTQQSVRHDERAVSIDAGRAKLGDTDYKTIKDKLQHGIDKAGVTKG